MEDRDPKAVMVGRRMATKREQAGFSQAELARRVGVTAGAVGQYETGRNLPKLAKLERIAMEIDTTVEWLLTGDDPEELRRAQTLNEESALRLLRGLTVETQESALAMLEGLAKQARKQ